MLRLLPVMLMVVFVASAVAAEPVRYVSDELVIVLRNSASASGAVVTSMPTGTRLVLLESDSESGYGRVRLDDGRIGWVQERYLINHPPAGLRAEVAGKQLAQAEAELKTLRDEHGKLQKEFARISEGRPPPAPEALTRELEDLRTQVQQLRQQNESLAAAGGQSGERQRTLLLGGALVAGGFLLAWLIRLLWPKRRWGEL